MDTELQQLAKTDRNPIQETRYQELLKGSNIPFTLQGGKASVGSYGIGGNGTSTQAFNQAAGMGGNETASTGIISTPTIDLASIYNNLHQNSGISDLEKKLSEQTDQYNKHQSAINDDPFLAEGNRTGRVQKLTTDFNNDTANLKNDIATKKADIETQLNLQTKQFDINSQAAQQSFQQFTSLLSMGALDNASGDTIANITRATGLSSDMIKSAIDARKVKDIPTQIINYDDGKNQGFAVINSQTGEVIKQQVVAASKPDKTASGGSGALSETRQAELDNKQAPQVLLAGAKQGKTFDDMVGYGMSHGMTAAEVLNIYLSVDYYHNSDAQIKAAKKKYGIK